MAHGAGRLDIAIRAATCLLTPPSARTTPAQRARLARLPPKRLLRGNEEVLELRPPAIPVERDHGTVRVVAGRAVTIRTGDGAAELARRLPEVGLREVDLRLEGYRDVPVPAVGDLDRGGVPRGPLRHTARIPPDDRPTARPRDANRLLCGASARVAALLPATGARLAREASRTDEATRTAHVGLRRNADTTRQDKPSVADALRIHAMRVRGALGREAAGIAGAGVDRHTGVAALREAMIAHARRVLAVRVRRALRDSTAGVRARVGGRNGDAHAAIEREARVAHAGGPLAVAVGHALHARERADCAAIAGGLVVGVEIPLAAARGDEQDDHQGKPTELHDPLLRGCANNHRCAAGGF